MSTSFKTVLLLLLGLTSFFLSNGTLEPDIMEARNFVTAREVLADDNWLIPTMNGELRITKPPLPTWITAVFMDLAPDADSLPWLRFPNGVMAILMMLFVFLLSREFSKNRRLAFVTAAVFGSSLMVMQQGKVASWDLYAQGFLLMGIYFLIRGLFRGGVLTFLIAGTALGLSFLSKGPVAHYGMLLPMLAAYLFVFKGDGFGRNRWPLVGGLAIFLLVSFWWPLLIFFQHPDAATAVAATEAGSWADRHVRPFYFYLHFPIFTGLWAAPVIASFFPNYARPRFTTPKHYRFFLLWALFTVLLLTIIPEKKERYLLPSMVPMAFLAGQLLHFLIENWENYSKWDKALLLTLTILGTVVCIGTGVFAYLYGYRFEVFDCLEIAFIFLVLAVLIILIWRTWQYRHTSFMLFLLVATTACYNVIAFPLIPNRTDKNLVYHGIENVQTDARVKDLPLYYLGDLHIKRVWFAGRKILPLDRENMPDLPIGVLSEDPPYALYGNSELYDYDSVDRYHMERQREDYWKYIYVLSPKK